MTDERWPRVKALFEAAVERPVGERDAFVAAAAGEDDGLRREVASLLTSDDSDAGFLDRLSDVSESLRADALAAQLAALDDTLTHTALVPGHRVGPYEIVALLGAGAMGEVYRAWDTKLNRDVALKVLPTLFALDPDRLARFTREAQLLATFNHPNIAAIYGLEESNGAQALVLELVDGPTLAQRIAEGPIPLVEGLGIARQLAPYRHDGDTETRQKVPFGTFEPGQHVGQVKRRCAGVRRGVDGRHDMIPAGRLG